MPSFKRVLLTLFVIAFSVSFCAQLTCTWVRKFGYSDEWFADIEKTPTGYLAVGATPPPGAWKSDLWLVWLDRNGVPLGQETFGSEDWDGPTDLLATGDGGYMVAGYKTGISRAWLFKIYGLGSPGLSWEKIFEGASASSLMKTSDSAVLISGSYQIANGNTSRYMWIAKVDLEGRPIWQRIFDRIGDLTGTNNCDEWWPQTRSSACLEGSTITCGSFQEGDESYGWLIKLDSSGCVVWERGYDCNSAKCDHLRDLSVAEDGSIVAVGISGNAAWIIKCDPDGNILWAKTFEYFSDLSRVVHTKEGGILAFGPRLVYDTSITGLLLLDSDGDLVEQRSIWILDGDISPAWGGGYVFAGADDLGQGTGYMGIVLKMDTRGVMGTACRNWYWLDGIVKLPSITSPRDIAREDSQTYPSQVSTSSNHGEIWRWSDISCSSSTGPPPGDCDGNGTVSIGEVQKTINMFLRLAEPSCNVDCDGDGTVSIGELQKVINAFLGLPASC